MDSNPNEEAGKVREYAWAYFALHADQRVKMFHFFIILETAMGAGMLAAKGAIGAIGIAAAKVFCALPAMMILIAVVFWKLDVRTRGMIQNAERTLLAVESLIAPTLPESLRAASAIFGNDEQLVKSKKPLRYSQCFGVVYASFAAIGLGGFLWLLLA